MVEHKDSVEFYETLPASFRKFASTVFAAYKGYEQHESKERLTAAFRKKKGRSSDEIDHYIECFLDKAEDHYITEKIRFTIMLYYLSNELCLSKFLCLKVAMWLQTQQRVSTDDFRATMKALAYVCGTNDTKASDYLDSTTFESINEVYLNTIDYLNEDILTPWVSDHIKATERIIEDTLQCDE